MNKIKLGCLAIGVIMLVGCAKEEAFMATPPYVTSVCPVGDPPLCGSGNKNVDVLINFIGDKPDSVTPDQAYLCKNSKINFTSSDGKQYAVIFSPGAGDKINLKQNVWSDSAGKLTVKTKNKKGCTTYTVLRKTANGGEILDPMVIIKR